MAELCARTTAFARVLLTGYGGDPLLAAPESHVAPRRALRCERATGVAGGTAAGRRAASAAQRRPDPLPAWVDRRWAREADSPSGGALPATRAAEQTGVAEAPLWRALFAYSDAGYNGRPLSIRFPFFDLRLLDFVRAIPPTPWLRDKRLLRQAVGDRLPASVATRPKTPMPGSVTLEQQQAGGRAGLGARPADRPGDGAVRRCGLARTVRAQPAAAQAAEWASQRPPIQLAYWLRHRADG